MSRTLKRKLIFGLFLGMAVLAGILYARTSISGNSVWVVVLVLLIPGRVQAFFYQSFYKGRRLLGQGNHQDALTSFSKFADDLGAKPWLRYLLPLSYSIYTPSIEAMTYNNIGCAHLETGQLIESSLAFDKALQIDPDYPLPFYNKAVLAALENEKEKSESFLETAKKLGYRKTSMDQVLHKVSAINARLQALGVKTNNR